MAAFPQTLSICRPAADIHGSKCCRHRLFKSSLLLNISQIISQKLSTFMFNTHRQQLQQSSPSTMSTRLSLSVTSLSLSKLTCFWLWLNIYTHKCCNFANYLLHVMLWRLLHIAVCRWCHTMLQYMLSIAPMRTFVEQHCIIVTKASYNCIPLAQQMSLQNSDGS